jgi:hypothetical protein
MRQASLAGVATCLPGDTRGEGVRMRTRAFLIGLLALLAFGLVAPAAQATETQTYNLKDVVETFPDVVPCREDLGLYDITIEYNLVFHETAAAIDLQNPDDPFDDILTPPLHITGTLVGTFVAVPEDASQPSFEGHFSQWFGLNSNKRNAAGTFTFTVNGKGSDGSKVKFHETAHFNVTPNGQVFEFDKPKCH